MNAKPNKYAHLGYEDFLALPALSLNFGEGAIDYELIESGVFHLTNQYRVKKNVAPLTYDTLLHQSALLHTSQMVTYRFFSHTNNKNKELKHLDDRVNAVGYGSYTALAENLYYGYVDLNKNTSYREIINEITINFINSKEHKENLIARDLSEMGCALHFEKAASDGFWQYYFVQNFGSKE